MTRSALERRAIDPTFRYQVRKYRKCGKPGSYRVTYHQYKEHGRWSAWWSYWG